MADDVQLNSKSVLFHCANAAYQDTLANSGALYAYASVHRVSLTASIPHQGTACNGSSANLQLNWKLMCYTVRISAKLRFLKLVLAS